MKQIKFNVLIFFLTLSACQSNNYIILKARKQKKQENGQWETSIKKIHWDPEETAIIICDMWDRHWCDNATKRVAEMAPRMNKVISEARKKGITIIHAPSSTMDYYKDYPQRIKMKTADYDKSSDPIKDWYYLDPDREPKLPVDDSDGGCDSNMQPENFEVWTHEIGTLEISDKDGISDNGKEINNYFIAGKIKNVILMGVHLNMCVLGRSFGIRGQIAQGRNVVFARDLTDSMYNPDRPPFVNHEEGTMLLIKHIEKYWCPSIESADLM